MDSSDTAKPAASAQRHRRFSLLRRFRRNTKGVVAIEFAMLALPFSMLVFAILESSISFAAQQVMTNITDDVARQFRTGQVRSADINPATYPTKLRDMICQPLQIVVSQGCPGLEIDLRRHDTFAQAAAHKIKFKADGDLDSSDLKIELGQSQSKNQLRVFYRWPVMTDLLRKAMSNMPDGTTLHYATVTWQNEPFDD